MLHRDIIAEIARRLPHRTQRDVTEIVDLLTEIWLKELAAGQDVNLPDIGRIRIDVQVMRAGGVLKKHGRLRRVYGRFRPTEQLKAQVQEVDQ